MGSGTLTATVGCDRCTWGAQIRGEEPIEMGTFLRNRLMEHQQEAHGLSSTPNLLMVPAGDTVGTVFSDKADDPAKK
jgi:hypothetical protein